MDSISATEFFYTLGGGVINGFPVLPAPVFHTPRGTPYLKSPGMALLAKPNVNVGVIGEFLNGFAPDLGFADYPNDPVELSPGAQLSKVAGQVCYVSFGPNRTKNERASRYFENIKSSGHGSVLEHSWYTFLLYGISRSLTHELVRHRVGTAFSQTSQRYVNGKVLRFVERPEYQGNSTLHEIFELDIDDAASRYADRTEKLLDLQGHGYSWLSAEAKTELRKRVQQAARSSLPNEVEAPMVFSANIRALRHIIEMRANPHAETEIRELFFRVFLCLRQAEPLLFGDYKLETLADGTHAVDTEFRKV